MTECATSHLPIANTEPGRPHSSRDRGAIWLPQRRVPGGEGTMGRAGGPGLHRLMLRTGVLMLAVATLGACAGSNPFESKYSKRIVEEGEPIPKGGGSYKVGQPYQLNGRTYYPGENKSYRAEGIASWYGPDFHGRATANGEVYDMNGISAAHPTLPLPSYVRVTNLANGRSIIVRLNDRGPYANNRLIDLSIGTAKALDFYGHGLARVRVEYVGPAPLEGSDDKILLATLRHGSPAPAPSQVMLASAKPFVPMLGDDGAAGPSADEGTPIPVERPFSLGANAPRPTMARASAAEPPADRRARSVVQVRSSAPGPDQVSLTAGAPVSAPVQSLGL